ncbi:protein of unknown function (plasmid) [Azospirillum baldaniorum]|uniref:Uncharacterized protein n=1 Tax=Azospirillum baldaniorum TaxID=1064539 RepID=A0A9P1NR37_9PROT|nr:protein of unknown function [Azospirillum baldaniorum]
MAAAPHPAVRQDGHPVADPLGDVRQTAHGVDGVVQVAGAVIGHNDPVHPQFGGLLRVVGAQHALQNQLALPGVPQAPHVAPPHVLGEADLVADGDPTQRGAELVGIVGVGRHAAVAQILGENPGEPARVGETVQPGAHRRLDRNPEAVADVVFAIGRHRRVHGQDQGLRPGPFGAPHQLAGALAAAPDIELEPQPRPGFPGDPLDGGDGLGGDAEGNADRGGGLGQFDLAVVPDQPGHGGGRHDQRHGLIHPEQAGGGVAFRHVHQNARLEDEAVECRFARRDASFVLGSAVDVLEQAAREAGACPLPGLGDVERRGHRHFPGFRGKTRASHDSQDVPIGCCSDKNYLFGNNFSYARHKETVSSTSDRPGRLSASPTSTPAPLLRPRSHKDLPDA